jgi:hypothetical protein
MVNSKTLVKRTLRRGLRTTDGHGSDLRKYSKMSNFGELRAAQPVPMAPPYRVCRSAML